MDEHVARWARIQAAERDMSLARFIGATLREHMLHEQEYERAMRAFAATRPEGGSARRRLPSRDEIHDRTALRR